MVSEWFDAVCKGSWFDRITQLYGGCGKCWYAIVLTIGIEAWIHLDPVIVRTPRLLRVAAFLAILLATIRVFIHGTVSGRILDAASMPAFSLKGGIRVPPLFARSPRSLPQAAAGIASNPGILFAAAARTRDRRALVVIALAYSFVGSDFRGLRRAAGFWWFSAGYAIADKLRLVDASVDLCVGRLLRIPTAALAWVCGSGPIPPRKPAASWPVTLLLLCAWVALPYSFDATLAANGVTVSTIRAFIAYENAQIDDH